MNLKETSITSNLIILNRMSDQALIAKIVLLAREERELLTSVLHHLREIEARRLFCSLGYSSLFDFTMKHLGYSEDQAYRRISAMRLLKEIPEIETRITAGEISLSHIGLAQSFFKQEMKVSQKAFSKQEKIVLFERIANKPIREATRLTLSLSSVRTQIKPDQTKFIAEDRIELKFQASAELQDKIEKLKGLLAHKNPNISLGELFEKLCDLGLEQWKPSKALKTERKSPAMPKAQIRRDIFRKANDECEICSSTYALEIDHIVPQAKGGDSSKINLRVLCRSCNQRAAIQEFGQTKMMAYLN